VRGDDDVDRAGEQDDDRERRGAGAQPAASQGADHERGHQIAEDVEQRGPSGGRGAVGGDQGQEERIAGQTRVGRTLERGEREPAGLAQRLCQLEILPPIDGGVVVLPGRVDAHSEEQRDQHREPELSSPHRT